MRRCWLVTYNDSQSFRSSILVQYWDCPTILFSNLQSTTLTSRTEASLHPSQRKSERLFGAEIRCSELEINCPELPSPFKIISDLFAELKRYKVYEKSTQWHSISVCQFASNSFDRGDMKVMCRPSDQIWADSLTEILRKQVHLVHKSDLISRKLADEEASRNPKMPAFSACVTCARRQNDRVE